MKRITKVLLPILLLIGAAFAQVPVLLGPVPHLQFLDANGHPLANGKIFTYDAGTTNLRNTYVDSTGTAQNTDPIILDATGSPSNGSVQTGIWLANQAYKFVAQNSLGVQQWSTDNVTGYFGLLNTVNTWTQPQTFTQPITITPVDNQIITGVFGNQTTLDFPPPVGNITLHFPSTNDTMVGRATTDTLTNKTLTNPVINGVSITGAPASYMIIANSGTGTTVNTLTKITGAPSTAQIAGIADFTGVVGITIAGAGATGSATIQQTGVASCVFDGATTAGDTVQISPTNAGNCRDVSAVSALNGQIIGRVLSTNGGAGTYPIILTLADPIKSFTGSGSSGTPISRFVTATGNMTAGTIVFTFAGNAIYNVAPLCWAQDRTAANATQVVVGSVSSVTVNGTGTDNVALFCLGN